MARRLFIAIELPEEAKAAIARARAAAPPAPGLRPVRDAQLHLTLRFLGDVDDARAAALPEALDRAAAAVAPFPLAIAGAGTFGGRRPRVLWAGIEAPPALRELAAAIEAAVAALGFPAADKPFAPHLTLGRAKAPRGDPALRAVADALQALRAGPVVVDRVVLFASVLGDGPPRHTALHAAVLGGGRGARH